jgi:hypothetical protein
MVRGKPDWLDDEIQGIWKKREKRRDTVGALVHIAVVVIVDQRE